VKVSVFGWRVVLTVALSTDTEKLELTFEKGIQPHCSF
jgi:hypothetical protein